MMPRPDLTVTATRTDGDATQQLNQAIAVRREGPCAWVWVTGQLTILTRRHLDDWLDWLITTGARQITVALATVEQIDEPYLSILRIARARLRSRDGQLLATAGRAPARTALDLATLAPRHGVERQAEVRKRVPNSSGVGAGLGRETLPSECKQIADESAGEPAVGPSQSSGYLIEHG